MSNTYEHPFDLGNLVSGQNGCVLDGIAFGGRFGHRVGSIGTFFGPNRHGIAVTAPQANGFGEIYLYSYRPWECPSSSPTVLLRGNVTNGELGHSFGFSDLDGDGNSEVLVGAPGANLVYVLRGGSAQASVINVADLNGQNGYAIVSEMFSGGRFGEDVSGALDLDKDGFQDGVVGAPFQGQGRSQDQALNGPVGVGYVFYGESNQGATGLFRLSEQNTFRVYGFNDRYHAGGSVSWLGNFTGNPDYYDVGIVDSGVARSLYLDGNYSVAGSEVFMDTNALTGQNGLEFAWARNVRGLHNINGDFYDDIVVSSEAGARCGVIFGAEEVVPGNSRIFLWNIPSGGGFQVTPTEYCFSIGAAGQFNDDDVYDIAFGNPEASANGASAGECRVVFGSASLRGSDTFNLDELNGANGVAFQGAAAGDEFGFDCREAGGRFLAVGAPGANSHVGKAYLIGMLAAVPATTTLASTTLTSTSIAPGSMTPASITPSSITSTRVAGTSLVTPASTAAATTSISPMFDNANNTAITDMTSEPGDLTWLWALLAACCVGAALVGLFVILYRRRNANRENGTGLDTAMKDQQQTSVSAVSTGGASPALFSSLPAADGEEVAMNGRDSGVEYGKLLPNDAAPDGIARQYDKVNPKHQYGAAPGASKNGLGIYSTPPVAGASGYTAAPPPASEEEHYAKPSSPLV